MLGTKALKKMDKVLALDKLMHYWRQQGLKQHIRTYHRVRKVVRQIKQIGVTRATLLDKVIRQGPWQGD